MGTPEARRIRARVRSFLAEDEHVVAQFDVRRPIGGLPYSASLRGYFIAVTDRDRVLGLNHDRVNSRPDRVVFVLPADKVRLGAEERRGPVLRLTVGNDDRPTPFLFRRRQRAEAAEVFRGFGTE